MEIKVEIMGPARNAKNIETTKLQEVPTGNIGRLVIPIGLAAFITKQKFLLFWMPLPPLLALANIRSTQ
jgi:hypothetical protein